MTIELDYFLLSPMAVSTNAATPVPSYGSGSSIWSTTDKCPLYWDGAKWSGSLTGITSGNVTSALGYTPLQASNQSQAYNDYSIPTATFVTLPLPTGGNLLVNGYGYRINLMTLSTGTYTGATYIVTQSGGAWTLTAVALADNTSNHPLLRISVAGTGLEIYHNHASTYTVRAAVQAVGMGNLQMATSMFGLEGSFSSKLGVGYYNNNQIWNSATLTNLNQLTNGPGYITSAGAAASASKLSILGTSAIDANVDRGIGFDLLVNSSGSTNFPVLSGVTLEARRASGSSSDAGTFQLFSSNGPTEDYTIRKVTGYSSGDIWGSWRKLWHDGSLAGAILADGLDLNTILTPGFYKTGSAGINSSPGGNYGQLFVSCVAGSDTITQTYTAYTDGAMYTRSGNTALGGGSWTAWRTILASQNFNLYAPTLTGTGASGSWAINITGKSNSTGLIDVNLDNAYASPVFLSFNRSSGNGLPQYVSNNLSFVPSTGALSALSFAGAGTGLTGTAAGLSIGGNAATATTAVNVTSLTLANVTTALGYTPSIKAPGWAGTSVASLDSRTISNPLTGLGYASGGRFRFGFENDTSGAFADIIDLSTYADATGGGFNALYFNKSQQRILHKWAAAGGTGWSVMTMAYVENTLPLTGGALSGSLQIGGAANILDITNSTAGSTRAILARGASDANFQLTAKNGIGTTINSSHASFGMEYVGAGPGLAAGFNFHRGGSALDGVVVFVTNNAEKMRLDASGRLGIGMNLPDTKLVLASGSDGINANDGVSFYGTSTNKQASILSYNTGGYSGDLRFNVSSKGSASLVTTAEVLRLAQGLATVTGNISATGTVTGTDFIGPGTSLTGTATVLNIGGNSATATKFATARTINGISFDGTANITILGNVDNTSDANKPVSTAQQTALNLKANSANPTLTNPTITDYIETLYAPAAGSSFTVSLSNGTIQKLTTNANATITLPTSIAGKGYTLLVAYGGVHTLTWAGGSTIKWAGGTAPSATSVNGKVDIYVFTCDGTNTYGRTGGSNY
jgi:hypothetical protein